MAANRYVGGLKIETDVIIEINTRHQGYQFMVSIRTSTGNGKGKVDLGR
jgi:hypothetical protein